MTMSNFSVSFLVNQSPKEVFNAIQNVQEWWSGFYSEEIKGRTENLHDEFSFRAGDGAHYSKQKLVEVAPDRKIVWLVTESELSFIENKDEWTGTKLIFDISEKDDKTKVSFTHEGLTPEIECYTSCAPAWTLYLENKLLPAIIGNKGSVSLNNQ
jgi:hypothetical protein